MYLLENLKFAVLDDLDEYGVIRVPFGSKENCPKIVGTSIAARAPRIAVESIDPASLIAAAKIWTTTHLSAANPSGAIPYFAW